MRTVSVSELPESVWESEHFRLHPLAEGVYAAIATEMGAAFSSAGLIDLGERTLVFDAFENPQPAEDLLEASIQLTGCKPTTVIISHWHPDHWGGLQVFADCAILATPATRQAMLPIAKEMEQEQRDPSGLEKELQATEARLAAETDPRQCQALEISVHRQRNNLLTLQSIKPTLPNQAFDGKIVFYGTARSVELIPTGKGHTESDCILQLPKERIAFIGDLGFFQQQPFMPYGFPSEWITLLNDLANGKAKIFVPGHGPLGRKADLLLEAQYIQAMENMIQQVIQRGSTVKDALRETLPPPFDAWQKIGHRFDANVRSSFKRQSQLTN